MDLPPHSHRLNSTHTNKFIRDAIEKGTVSVEQVPTESMVADVMTKALPFDKFMRCPTIELVIVVKWGCCGMTTESLLSLMLSFSLIVQTVKI